MEPEDALRWLLVSQEAGVPNVEEASRQWSIDDLFVDQFAVPVLVIGLKLVQYERGELRVLVPRLGRQT